MPRASRSQFANAVYHVTARGNRGDDIFTSETERRRFLELLAKSTSECGWSCVAYCLMTNHFHLIIATPEPNLSKGMHALNGVYARWFNWRHGLEGHLFQRRYHAALVESDHHMLESCRYVLLNPVRAQLAPSPAGWRWSSYRATAGLEPQPQFLATSLILSYFGNDDVKARRAFRSFVHAASRLVA
ncbi:MAG: transposase [Gaiellaceae bacterium]